MDRFYIIGEAITAPCDILYNREVHRLGNGVHYVRDKVFADTEGIVREINTFQNSTRLIVKFSGHRQTVEVILRGEDHAANPLVSGGGKDPQILNTEPLKDVTDADPLVGHIIESTSTVLMPIEPVEEAQ